MNRFMLTAVLVLGAIAPFFGCDSASQPDPQPDDVQLTSSAGDLTDDPLVVDALATLVRVSPTRWTMVVAGAPIVLDQAQNTFTPHSAGVAMFEETSVAVAQDLATFLSDPQPPETNASKLKWLGKLIKGIGKVLSGGGGSVNGAQSCGEMAVLACGAGCVASMTSTVLSCKFTCQMSPTCGGGGL